MSFFTSVWYVFHQLWEDESVSWYLLFTNQLTMGNTHWVSWFLLYDKCRYLLREATAWKPPLNSVIPFYPVENRDFDGFFSVPLWFRVWLKLVLLSLVPFSKFPSPVLGMAQKAWRLSYASRRTKHDIWIYDALNNEVLSSKEATIDFLMEKRVLKRFQQCPKCLEMMQMSKCSEKDAVEEVQFRCDKKHYNSSTQGRFCT